MELPGGYDWGKIALRVCNSKPNLYQFGGLDVVPDILIINFFLIIVGSEGVFFDIVAWEFSVLVSEWSTKAMILYLCVRSDSTLSCSSKL